MGDTLLGDYLAYNARGDIAAFSTVPTARWLEMGEQRALETFRLAVASVPAYREFLAPHGISAEDVRTIEDFARLPLTDKGSYFERFPLAAVTVGGQLGSATAIHYSSGSTGEPHYWPKSAVQDMNAYKGLEFLYVSYFDIDTVQTLLVNCFGMGPWTAGEMVHTSAKMMGEKGLKISVISPGLNADQFFNIFRDLAGSFEQVIVGGYPSFLRDLVEEGVRRGVDVTRHNVKILTGGEKYSEHWRQYMAAQLGMARPHRDIASVLGTSETGVTSTSTPFSDFLRMYLHRNADTRTSLIGGGELPSVTQFIPPARYAEIVDGEIVVTCMGMVPMVRFNTHDRGQIFTPQQVRDRLPASFWAEYAAIGELADIPNLPILTIDGRADALTVFGANVYHDQIGHVLEAPTLEPYVTGRFHAEQVESANAETHLKFTLELKPSVESNERLTAELRELIVTGLAATSSEYASVLAGAGEHAKPLVELLPYRTDGFLAPSGKIGAGRALRTASVAGERER